MMVNGLKLPTSFVALIDRPKPLHYWMPKGQDDEDEQELVDAYGNTLSSMDLDLYENQQRIEEKTNSLPEDFHVADLLSGDLEERTARYRQYPGFIPYITDFSRIVCFGRTISGEKYCFDFRENPGEPSIIYWDDGCWRLVAPNFDTFIGMFEPL